ncbi:hypothetical protein F4677DRAFT_317044 [Hypoxylon crocopeplum]|nr:hypothetical protein F4677DRAFT_317044 [Hypoxylon crocopeplum]
MMASRDHRQLGRPTSTISTASIWSERTMAGMGLAMEHTVSSITVANTEGDAESIPLRPWNTSEQELETGPTDYQQNVSGEAQADQGNQAGNRNTGDALSNVQPPTAKSIKLVQIWWLEVVSCLLVVAMVAALVGTISPYENQPLPRWPYTLSINTIVTFYSEVMRAAMVLALGECLSQLKWSWFTQPRPLDHIEHYDNASRGPWGSLGMLWAIRLGALLPSVGGILMVLSLLIVPFTQQIILFYSCNVLDTTLNASIPKTNFASSGTSMHIGANINSISPHIQAVMNSGVYDSAPKRVSFTCSTGNCTFQGVYHSMGWCSRCMDVSDQIEVRPSRHGFGANFTLPSSNLSATAGVGTFVMGQKYTTTPIQAILGWDENGTADKLSDTPWGNRGYGAAECTINPCVRSYTGTVTGGNLTETLLSTSQTWNQNYWLSSIDVSCLNFAEVQALHNAGYDFDPGKTTWLAYNLSAAADDAFNPTVLNETKTTIRPECIYQTYQGQVQSLSVYLGMMFTGAVSYGPNALSGPSILQSIFQEGNVTFSTIDDTFSRLAQALTVWTRQQGGNVTGQVYISDTCVSARWGWLAYPLSLVVGTIVFVVWTIDHTRRNEGSKQDYKSSPLALLFHRLGSVGSEGATYNIGSKDVLQKKAKTMKVVFQGTEKVWRFIEVDQPHTSDTIK